MNATIVVIGAGSVEWADRLRLVGGIEHHRIHGWRACLSLLVGRIPVPGAVANNMCGARLVV